MIFDWSTYLHLAQELAGRASLPSAEEARLRSAISRAYYAVFHPAWNRAKDEGLRIPPGRSVHTCVWDYFSRSKDNRRREIGVNGDRLRKARNKADYHDFILHIDSLTFIALRRAEKVISDLGRI